jgi:hypothetical protein
LIGSLVTDVARQLGGGAYHAGPADRGPQSEWHEDASRYLMQAATVWDESRGPGGAPSNVYEVATHSAGQSALLEQGMNTIYNFVNWTSSTVFHQESNLLGDFLQWAGSTKVRNTIWGMGCGVFVSNILADLFVLVVCEQLKRTYRRLVMCFRHGDVSEDTVQGSALFSDDQGRFGLCTSPKNAFSSSSYLPGTMWFSIILGWLVAFHLVLFSWTGAIILYYWHAEVWDYCGGTIVYLTGTITMSAFLKYIVVDMWLTSGGEIHHPYTFTPVWIVLLISNFIIGVTLALIRLVIIMTYALVSACFLHFSLLPRNLLFFDTGYYSFLCMSYTWYERHSPIKKAFNTLATPQVHRLRGPAKDSAGFCGDYSKMEDCTDAEGQDPMSDRAQRRLKAKKRFNLALTLYRNPSLMKDRKTPLAQRPCDSVEASETYQELTEEYTEEVSVNEEEVSEAYDDGADNRKLPFC